MTTLYAIHPTRLGDLLLVGERAPDGGTILTGCYLPGHRGGPAVGPSWREDAGAFSEAAASIDAHLAGRPDGPAVRVDLRDGTPFQRRAWEALRAIPWGATVTYGELAARLGRPGAARAVGGAVARNPVAILVPCHRVVGADGSLTGYAGGVELKRALLEIEGVRPGAGGGAPAGAGASAGPGACAGAGVPGGGAALAAAGAPAGVASAGSVSRGARRRRPGAPARPAPHQPAPA
jgi:methylated-DNA-[protein]-cysteine S-methyltransferase